MEAPLIPNAETKRKRPLAPSKSTTYISNLPFAFTNCDVSQVFTKYGKIVKITILRDKESRKSRGVAFVQFSDPESAWNCVRGVDGSEMFGRTLRANIAKDNGRAPEFIRRREYPDKSRCYECGEVGHLSYSCPKNILGNKEPPPKKKKKFKSNHREENDEESSENEVDDDSLGAVIRYEQELREGEEFLRSQGNAVQSSTDSSKTKVKLKQSSYFSDEEEEIAD